MKWRINQNGFLCIIPFTWATVLFQGCAPFSALPGTVKKPLEINGLYSNDCDSTDSWGKRKLWSFVDIKYNSDEDSLSVHFETTGDNKIKAQLKRKNETLRESIIEGKFKEDNCYYPRKVFYIVPILPVIWWYSNEKNRIYRTDNVLVCEYTYDHGGAFIFFAGGNDGNFKWHYQPINK